MPLRAKRATARYNWPAVSDYVQSRAEGSALEASCREGRASSPELPMRWTDSMVGSVGLPEASGGMRCTGRFRSRGVRRGAPGPSAGFVGCTSRNLPPNPCFSVAVQRENHQKVTPSCETPLLVFFSRPSEESLRDGFRGANALQLASLVRVQFSLPCPSRSLSLFSPCSESQSASDPTAAPPSMACLAGYLGRDTCRIRTAAWERGGLLLTGPS